MNDTKKLYNLKTLLTYYTNYDQIELDQKKEEIAYWVLSLIPLKFLHIQSKSSIRIKNAKPSEEGFQWGPFIVITFI